MKLSIIIPVFNEIKYLAIFTDNLIKSFGKENVEYVFINDGSTDGSKQWLENYLKTKDKNIFYLISLDNNNGKGFAIREGLKRTTGDLILFQDSDLELDPNDSLEMYNIIKKNDEMQVIFGTRYLSGKIKRNVNLINGIINRLNTFIFNVLYFQSISDLHCGTKIIRKSVKDKIFLNINDFGFEIDIATQIAKNNFYIYEYGISYFARTHAEGKKITWVDGLKSYYYLFKTRFLNNESSILCSIIFSAFYMTYIGSYFGLGLGKLLVSIFLCIIGCFIGLHKKLAASALVFLFIYFGSLFSNGNGKIYTVLLAFFIGLYVSHKVSKLINRNSSNRFIKFFV